MRIILPVFLITLFFTVSVTAQNHVNGYAAGSVHNVYLVDSGGTVSTACTTGFYVYGLVMSRANDMLMAVDYDGSIIRIDPRTGSVIGTLVSGLGVPQDIAVDQNGDYFVTSDYRLLKVNHLGSVTTMTTLLPDDCNGGMDVDIDSGGLLIQSRYGSDDPLLRVSRTGSIIVTLATGGDVRYGITQNIRTGDIYMGSCCGNQGTAETLYRVSKGSSVASVWYVSTVPPVGVYSLKSDRSSTASPRLILGAYHSNTPGYGPGGLFHLNINTQARHRFCTIEDSLFETEILYRRNLYSLATEYGKWTLGLRIPEDSEKSYGILASMTGVRPGMNLQDGRRVNIYPDVLTMLSMNSTLHPFLTGNWGVLDSSGSGAAMLDLSSLGSAANGNLLWFVGVTLGPLAPMGIRTITDPIVLRIEGL